MRNGVRWGGERGERRMVMGWAGRRRRGFIIPEPSLIFPRLSLNLPALSFFNFLIKIAILVQACLNLSTAFPFLELLPDLSYDLFPRTFPRKGARESGK